ncbi:FAD:protein FMN transferase [Methanosalsum zhilinae]|nr:FAD:protein FMN transferase [Methanosalsum zhilinae]
MLLAIAASIIVYSGTEDIQEEQEFKVTRNLMNTPITITVIHTDETYAYESIERAFDKIENIETTMSHFKNNSEVSRLNQEGVIHDADPELVYVIETSIHYSELSDGAFDITIKPVLDLWESKFKPGGTFEPPTPEEINNTLELVDYSSIEIEGNSIKINPAMSIVLGGIAKGYAVDMAIESLKNDGIENAFVNAGGDGKYIGLNSRQSPWKVGLQNPDREQEFITIINIHDMSVATSGNYERYFSDDARVSHIADPRTGYPSEELISATVIAEDAISADSLAIAVFVMGKEDGLKMIEQLEKTECLIITDDKQIVRSSGFSNYEAS